MSLGKEILRFKAVFAQKKPHKTVFAGLRGYCTGGVPCYIPLSTNLPSVPVHDLSCPHSQSHTYACPVFLAFLPSRIYNVSWSVMSEAVTNTLVLQVGELQLQVAGLKEKALQESTEGTLIK